MELSLGGRVIDEIERFAHRTGPKGLIPRRSQPVDSTGPKLAV